MCAGRSWRRRSTGGRSGWGRPSTRPRSCGPTTGRVPTADWSRTWAWRRACCRKGYDPLVALTFTLDPAVTPALRDGVLDLWTDVSNAGGAVGFVPPVTREAVRPELVRHLAGM